MTEKKIALYARTSGTGANASLAVQVDSCRRLALSLGCATPELFIDRGTVGVAAGAALEDLIKACADGRFHAIATASPDRLSRDPAKQGQIITRFSGYRVAVHFLNEKAQFVIDPM
jgi:DNA invertase Pin-like site-specific DNA recombinase